MRKFISVVTTIVFASVAVACGSDDDGQVDVPEEAPTSAYTRAIMESSSHDEILLPDGGDMVVAVDCVPDSDGVAVLTVVADGLEDGIYVGAVEPSTGVDLSLQVSAPGEAVGAAQMTLDDDAYVVTFDSIEGGQFDLLGC